MSAAEWIGDEPPKTKVNILILKFIALLFHLYHSLVKKEIKRSSSCTR
jgi:hypothetical protein